MKAYSPRQGPQFVNASRTVFRKRDKHHGPEHDGVGAEQCGLAVIVFRLPVGRQDGITKIDRDGYGAHIGQKTREGYEVIGSRRQH